MDYIPEVKPMIEKENCNYHGCEQAELLLVFSVEVIGRFLTSLKSDIPDG